MDPVSYHARYHLIRNGRKIKKSTTGLSKTNCWEVPFWLSRCHDAENVTHVFSGIFKPFCACLCMYYLATSFCLPPCPCRSITPRAAMASRCLDSAAFLMYSRALAESGDTDMP